MGVALIQLELVSLFVLYLLMCDFFEVGLKTLSLVILFCVLASEAAIGLSFLVISSRHRQQELEKFNI